VGLGFPGMRYDLGTMATWGKSCSREVLRKLGGAELTSPTLPPRDDAVHNSGQLGESEATRANKPATAVIGMRLLY